MELNWQQHNYTVNTSEMFIDNLIIIKKKSLLIIKELELNDIKTALNEWLDLYIDDFESNLVFKLYTYKTDGYIIQADKRLNNDDFFYLVNFLYHCYSFRNKIIEIEGFIIGEKDNILENKKLLVSALPDDLEYVSVVTNENVNYKVDHDGKIIPFNNKKQYYYPDNLILDYPEILKASDYFQQKQKKVEKKATIRCAIFFLIASLFFLLCMHIRTYDVYTFEMLVFSLGIGIGLWFWQDYKMLRINKLYLISLIISFLFFGFSFFLKRITQLT